MGAELTPRAAPRSPRRGRALVGRGSAPPDPATLRTFGTRLRAWYHRNARDLPWRRTRDPYHVLVSELMLQQTQVSRVLGFYSRFLERFPTLESLAAAREARVVAEWSGLGYYARARNLHRLSRQLTRDGSRDGERDGERDGSRDGRRDGSRGASLPDTPEALRKLPGIGAYTAGAVASFAYEQRAALVDTNVARVLTRVFAPRLRPKHARDQKRIWTLADAALPRSGRATWTHNQALMELGALVCTARVKRCGVCPVHSVCATFGEAKGER